MHLNEKCDGAQIVAYKICSKLEKPGLYLSDTDVSILGPDLKVVAEEFSSWQDSNRRIDLLCISREAQLGGCRVKEI